MSLMFEQESNIDELVERVASADPAVRRIAVMELAEVSYEPEAESLAIEALPAGTSPVSKNGIWLETRNTALTDAIRSAKTILVNAVMGFTPHFYEGSRELDQTIDRNVQAQKLYGGGDTLQEFKNLSPGLYLAAMDDAKYYFFTGGGTVLKAIEEGSPYGLEPVKALMENVKTKQVE